MNAIKYWFFGLPFVGGSIGSNNPESVKYWFFGLPEVYKSTSSAPPGPGTGAAYRLMLLGVG